MDRSRPDQLLETWDAVASSAVRPATPPRRTVVRSSLPGLSLAGAALLVAALVLGVMWLGGPGSDPGIGGVTSPDPSPTATAEPTPSATPAPNASDSPAPTATPSPTPSLTPRPGPVYGSCAAADLFAAITTWEGAAGSRIATVVLTYTGAENCWIPSTSGLRLVDGAGAILIDGASDDSTALQTVIVGDRLTTLVRASNYCGGDPVPQVTIAFIADGGGTVTAAPTPADATVPPCNGPGQPATIEMQPWTE